MRGLGFGEAGAAQPGTARSRAAIATATAAASLLVIDALDTRCSPPVLDVGVAPGVHELGRSIPFQRVERDGTRTKARTARAVLSPSPTPRKGSPDAPSRSSHP